MDYANLIAAACTVLSVFGGVVFYHIKQSARLSVLENKISTVEEQLESLEDRIGQDLRDLGQKLDRFVYALAGLNTRHNSDG